MTNVQLDTDVLNRLKKEKISNRDTYNDVLRRMFKKLDDKNIHRNIPLIDKDEVI